MQRCSKWVDRGPKGPGEGGPNQNEPPQNNHLFGGPLHVPCPWAAEGLATPVLLCNGVTLRGRIS